jgi:glycosyltransferase involved in cell wall biosynthesis
MNIWLCNPYGPIPGEGWRDYRFAMLGKALAENGHDVIWWTANFSHHFKQFRSESWEDRTITDGFRIRLVPTRGYTKNVSVGRIRYETVYAWNTFRRAVGENAPDIIVGTDPSQIIGFMSVKLAKRLKTPLVLDVFDQWPELFYLAFPGILRLLAPAVLLPFFLLRRHNLRRADAITALCNTYLELGRRVAPRLREERSQAIFNGIDVSAFRSRLPSEEERVGLAHRMGKNYGDKWAIFAGTLGNNYDVFTLLQAAVLLRDRGNPLAIRIAGEGPLRPQVTEFIESHRLDNIRYVGKLSHEELIKIYGICDIGLCSYGPYSNVAMPDKAYDYMAAGLPLVNSLRGELESFIRERAIGVQYKAGDPVSLADALDMLGTDDERRQGMARNSYDAAVLFDQHVQYTKYVRFLEDLNGRGKQPA